MSDKMIKYKTTEFFCNPYAKIEKVEVERETDKCIWIGNNRHLKKTESEKYFASWNEAHKYILDLANNNVNRAILQLERAKGLLVNIYGLKEEV